MSVKDTLEKLCHHNEAIRGAIVRANGAVHHTFNGVYEAVDANVVADQVEQILMLSGTLDAGEASFQTVFLEYDQHSVFARQMEHGVLVLVTSPMQRAGFKKVQVGVNLFMKQLNVAIDSSLGPATQSVGPAIKEGLRIDPADARPKPAEKIAEVRADQEAEKPAEEKPKKKRFYRGVAY